MTLMSVSAFALMTGAYVLGGVQLAAFARSNEVLSLIICVAAYLFANTILWHFLKIGAYGPMMVISALAVLVGNSLASTTLFAEHYSVVQMTGIALAMAAIVLVGLGGSNGTSV